MTTNVDTTSCAVYQRRINQFGTRVDNLQRIVKVHTLVNLDGDIADIVTNRHPGDMVGRVVRIASSMADRTIRPAFRSFGIGRHVVEVSTTATGVVFEPGIGVIVERTECGLVESRVVRTAYGRLRNGRISVACIAGAARCKRPTFGIMGVAIIAVTDWMPCFSNTGTIVLGVGVANLAETAICIKINPAIIPVRIGYGPCCRIEICNRRLDHGKIRRAMQFVALPAFHLLRTTLDLEMGAHIQELRLVVHPRQVIVAVVAVSVEGTSQVGYEPVRM